MQQGLNVANFFLTEIELRWLFVLDHNATKDSNKYL